MYLFLFFLFEIHFFLHMGLVTIIDIHCSYIPYIMMYVFSFHISLHVLFLFFLYTHVSYIMYAIYCFYFTLRCRDEFCLKCFRNTICQSLSCHRLSSCKVFEEFVLGEILLYLISEYELNDL